LPRRLSKFSMLLRWKKYSFPSSPVMNPNPRSGTSFLIVPFGIERSFLELKLQATDLFEKKTNAHHKLVIS